METNNTEMELCVIMNKFFKRGDWIPDAFKKIFKLRSGTDLPTCVVFSKIVYWLSPKKNGKKRYYGKQLKLSVSNISEQTYLSKKQVSHAMEKLEKKYKFINRTVNGTTVYVSLNVEIIEKVLENSFPNMFSKNEVAIQICNTHIHKEQHRPFLSKFPKGVTELNYCDKDQIIEEVEKLEIALNTKQNEKSMYSMSEDKFYSICRTTKYALREKLNYMSEAELIEAFIVDDESSYPAFSRFVFLYNSLYEHYVGYLTSNDAEFKNLLQTVSVECISNLDVYSNLLVACRGLDVKLLSVTSVADLKLKNNLKLTTLESEIKTYEQTLCSLRQHLTSI